MRQGKSEITKRMSMIAVVEEEDEDEFEDEELDKNSNKMKSNESLTVEAGEPDQELGTKA